VIRSNATGEIRYPDLSPKAHLDFADFHVAAAGDYGVATITVEAYAAFFGEGPGDRFIFLPSPQSGRRALIVEKHLNAARTSVLYYYVGH
jgi:hypothetical protein